MGEAQSLDLGELGLVGEGRQNLPQLVQRVVQVMHAVPLAVVGLHPPVFLHHMHGGLAPRAPAPPLFLLLLRLRAAHWTVRAAAGLLAVGVREEVAAVAVDVGVDRVHVVLWRERAAR